MLVSIYILSSLGSIKQANAGNTDATESIINAIKLKQIWFSQITFYIFVLTAEKKKMTIHCYPGLHKSKWLNRFLIPNLLK